VLRGQRDVQLVESRKSEGSDGFGAVSSVVVTAEAQSWKLLAHQNMIGGTR
jgi:hypothetical protein